MCVRVCFQSEHSSNDVSQEDRELRGSEKINATHATHRARHTLLAACAPCTQDQEGCAEKSSTHITCRCLQTEVNTQCRKAEYVVHMIGHTEGSQAHRNLQTARDVVWWNVLAKPRVVVGHKRRLREHKIIPEAGCICGRKP